MTKRRSSLKGRGSEILFGEPTAVEIEPRGSTMALSEAEPLEPESVELEFEEEHLADLADDEPPAYPSPEAMPPPDAEELERALYEEARDGELGPGEEEDLSLVDELPPPTPEMEMAFYEEAVGAEEPPEPVAEAPFPTVEETMDERDLREVEMIFEPPDPEVADVANGVLPPRPDSMVLDLGEAEPLTSYDVQRPEERVEWLELPDRPLTAEEEKRLLQWIGRARLKALDEEISKVYDQVLSKVGDSDEIATDCYNQLLKARDIVLRRQAARIPQAEYYVEQVRARLKRAAESESGAKKYAWWITIWGFAWGVAFLAVLFLLNHSWFQTLLRPTGVSSDLAGTEILLRAMVWGGIGGVVAVLYSLFKHVGLRDFDTQYNLSYVGKPFLGLVLGATVYMIFELMRTLGILPAGLQSGSSTAATVTPWIIYPLAWASGFKENRIFDLVDRVIKRIFSGKEEKEPEVAPEPGAGEG